MSPATVLLFTLVVLVVVGLALRLWWVDWEERRALIERSALSRVEAQAGTLPYRLDAALRRTRFGKRIERELDTAGLSISVFLGTAILVGSLAGGFVIANGLLPAWLAPLGSYAAWRSIKALLARQRQKRNDEFVAQLPELARTISNAASAGRSLPSAIRLAARELEEPAKSELHAVAEELRIGQSLDQALDNLGQRLPSREVGVLVTTLLIQQRSGGDLVRALREMARTLEKRKDLRGEIRSLMAGAVYTGYLVMLLGIGALLGMNAMSPGVLDRVLANPIGIVAMLVATVLYAVGVVLIRRQQAIEV